MPCFITKGIDGDDWSETKNKNKTHATPKINLATTQATNEPNQTKLIASTNYDRFNGNDGSLNWGRFEILQSDHWMQHQSSYLIWSSTTSVLFSTSMMEKSTILAGKANGRTESPSAKILSSSPFVWNSDTHKTCCWLLINPTNSIHFSSTNLTTIPPTWLSSLLHHNTNLITTTPTWLFSPPLTWIKHKYHQKSKQQILDAAHTFDEKRKKIMNDMTETNNMQKKKNSHFKRVNNTQKYKHQTQKQNHKIGGRIERN